MERTWKKTILGMALAGFGALALCGQTAPAPAAPPAGGIRCTTKELGRQSFTLGVLKISMVLEHQLAFGDYFIVDVENTSADFSAFDPWDLVVVNNGGRQAKLDGEGPFPLAPGARTSRRIQILAGPSRITGENLILPARIYLGEQLVATITDPSAPEPPPKDALVRN